MSYPQLTAIIGLRLVISISVFHSKYGDQIRARISGTVASIINYQIISGVRRADSKLTYNHDEIRSMTKSVMKTRKHHVRIQH